MCICAYMRVCICVYLDAYIYATFMHACNTGIHTCMHMHIYIHANVQINI